MHWEEEEEEHAWKEETKTYMEIVEWEIKPADILNQKTFNEFPKRENNQEDNSLSLEEEKRMLSRNNGRFFMRYFRDGCCYFGFVNEYSYIYIYKLK